MSVKNYWPPHYLQAAPHQLYVRSGQPIQTSGSTSTQTLAKWSENLVADLYEASGWRVIARRVRMRGSEIDLAVMNSMQSEARIIEVKCRTDSSTDLAAYESLLPHRKQLCLSKGAEALASQFMKSHPLLSWSIDLVVVQPFHRRESHLLTTWMNVFSLHTECKKGPRQLLEGRPF